MRFRKNMPINLLITGKRFTHDLFHLSTAASDEIGTISNPRDVALEPKVEESVVCEL